MSLLKKLLNRKDTALKDFTGRQISHISKRITKDGTTKDIVIAKGGRVVAHDGFVKIINGEENVFICPEKEAKCNTLMSGNGAAVEGNNQVTGEYDKLIIYYTKLN